LFEVGSPAGGNRGSEGGVELEVAEEIDAFTLEVVAAGNTGLFGFAVEDAVGDGFDIAGGIKGPLADGLMSDVAEKEGIEALGRGFGEAGEFEAAGGEVAEGAGEEGFEFTGGPGVGGGAPGTREAGGRAGAGDRWCRNDMGRQRRGRKGEEGGGQEGIALGIDQGVGEMELTVGASEEDWGEEEFFVVAVFEGLHAEGAFSGFGKERVGGEALGEGGIEEAGSEDVVEIPLAGLEEVEDVDDVAAGVALMESEGGEV
jgi:hypothetical protein